MAKTLDLQPSKIVMTDEDTLAAYTIHARTGGIDINAKIRPNLIHAPVNSDLQIISEPGYRLSLMSDALDEVFGYDNDDGIISMPKQSGVYTYLNTSSFSIPASSSSKINFDAVLYDMQNEYDKDTNYRFTAKKPGFYLVQIRAIFQDAGADHGYDAYIHKNGSRVAYANTHTAIDGPITVFVAAVLHLDANDYIEAFAFNGDITDRYLVWGIPNTIMTIHKIA